MATNRQLICLSMILFWLPFVIGIITNDPTNSFGVIFGIRTLSIISGMIMGHVFFNVFDKWYKNRRRIKFEKEWEEWKPAQER